MGSRPGTVAYGRIQGHREDAYSRPVRASAAALTRMMPATTHRRLDSQPADLATTVAEATGRPLVIVVRDVHRHGWMAATLRDLLASRPDATVVEMCLPHGRPHGGAGYLVTYGSSAVCGIAPHWAGVGVLPVPLDAPIGYRAGA